MGLRIVASLAVLALAQSALNAQVVISQIYGGGGNAGATFKNDFIELLNIGTTPVNISGWSVQQGSATNAGWNNNGPLTPIGTGAVTVLQPGQYYLIQEAAGAGGTVDLPTPDAVGTIMMGATSGKVALVNSTTALVGACPSDSSIQDVIGYANTANCFEGAPTLAPANTTSVQRNNNGCVDTGNNLNDTLIAVPVPRNSASPFSNCAGTPPTGVGQASSPDPVCNTATVTLSVAVTPGTNPVSTGLTATINLAAIGGPNNQSMFDDGPGGGHGDAVAGDNIFTINPTVAAGTSAGLKTMSITVADAQLRSSLTSVQATVDRCFPSANGIASPIALCTSGGDTDILVFFNRATTGDGTPASVVANLSLIGGSASQTLFDDGTNGDRLGGDDTWTYRHTVPSGLSLGAKNIPFIATDVDNRTATGANTLNIIACAPAASTVVISQLYGGGGNTGAPFNNDYIELFNRSGAPVDIGGWSVQYSAAAGAFNNKTDLPASPVILPPGGYYLIQELSGGPSGFPLPTPDAIGTINMSGTDGKVALVNDTTLVGANCNAASIMDLVGYGTTANCFEGAFYSPSGSNSFAMFRLQDGCQDNNQNAPDFFPFPPNPRNSGTPHAPCVCRGDVNGDGIVNGLDVQAFANCLTAGGSCTGADVNNDTVADAGDVLPMVNALLAGACAP